jgi:hypothetical protein
MKNDKARETATDLLGTIQQQQHQDTDPKACKVLENKLNRPLGHSPSPSYPVGFFDPFKLKARRLS